MSRSKVYFTNLRISGKSLIDKLENLVTKSGMFDIKFDNKFAAIKIHFGEPGNVAYIRPNYAARIARLIRSKNGLPFLTDSNTLYKGRRSNAVNHLQSAMENGFNPISADCNVIIADGLKGTDFREITINQKHCKTAKIGTSISEADIIISMNHFKGHELTGFGGALKNLGMGSASMGGKLEMHSDSKPAMNISNCVSCGTCVKNCAHDAIHLGKDKKAFIDYDKCVGCGQCIALCRYDAVQPSWGSSASLEKIAEYSLAVIQDKPNFHINFIMNVSPDCDCWNMNDQAIVPDIGICASFDPVAIDQASYDLVNMSPIIKGSKIDGQEGKYKDKFRMAHPETNGQIMLDYAEKIGLGKRDYELIDLN